MTMLIETFSAPHIRDAPLDGGNDSGISAMNNRNIRGETGRLDNINHHGKISNNNYAHRSIDSYASRPSYTSRDSHHFVAGAWEGLGGSDDEADEQPAELVPLGIPHRKRGHSHSTKPPPVGAFHEFYSLTDESLGAGAYGSVRTCISRRDGTEYAVKIVTKADASHTRSRILREVDTFELCKDHPNIVNLIEWFEDDASFYLVFEKMRGGPLLEHIQRKRCFTEAEAARVTRDIASALKFLHDKGIAHRDVKPENILCTEKERVSPVKLCDLDLASVRSERALQPVQSEPDLASPVGSAEFMAPEVVDAFVGDALKYDKRCDLWSLGVIVYIMLCGYPPFYGCCDRQECGWDDGEPCEECQMSLFERIQTGEYDFPEEEWETVSDEAKHLIRHLLVKNAKERFTADDVLELPWVASGAAPKTTLLTPGNLTRKDSMREVQQMSEHFNVMSRHVAARISQVNMDQSFGRDDLAAMFEAEKHFVVPLLPLVKARRSGCPMARLAPRSRASSTCSILQRDSLEMPLREQQVNV